MSKGPKQDATEARLESLEHQVGLLRREATDERGRGHSGAGACARELDGIQDDEALEAWVRRWSRKGVLTTVLQGLAKAHPNIPYYEADRIPEIATEALRGPPIETTSS